MTPRFSARTLGEFEDACSGLLVLRDIDRVFEDSGIPLSIPYRHRARGRYLREKFLASGAAPFAAVANARGGSDG